MSCRRYKKGFESVQSFGEYIKESTEKKRKGFENVKSFGEYVKEGINDIENIIAMYYHNYVVFKERPSFEEFGNIFFELREAIENIDYHYKYYRVFLEDRYEEYLKKLEEEDRRCQKKVS
jgi:hypothetical protein